MTPRTGAAKALCDEANQYIIDFMKSIFTAANNNQTDFIADLRSERNDSVPYYAETPVIGYSTEMVTALTTFIDQFLELQPESMTALQARFEADQIRETARSATRHPSSPRPR